MAETELPALHGLDPLGFLAALGVLRLLDDGGLHPRLRWDRMKGSAVLESDLDGVDAVVEQLQATVAGIERDAVLPGVGAGFPLRAGLSGGDPMRCELHDFAALRASVLADHGTEAARWLDAVVTDLGADEKGRALLSPWMAPSGKQTVETYFSKSLDAVRRRPEHLREALLGWRRLAGFTGEYLDHRVLNDAASDPMGTSTEAGVPGATWLATMALPLLRVSAITSRGRARSAGTMWHVVGGGSIAIWPLWEPPLGVPAVRAILEHPELDPARNRAQRLDRRRLAALGVFAVGGARRQGIEGRKSAGVLAPIAPAELELLLAPAAVDA